MPAWNAKDSILAMDLTTGAIKWSTGPPRFDEWNFGCLPGSPPNNCPNPGPDHDTGDGTHLYDIPGPNGQVRRAVGAGQKSGEFWMLDAITGAIIWSASVGPGSTQGGIQWGTATDGQRVYFTSSNAGNAAHTLPSGQTINYSSFGALDVATGRVVWQVPEPRGGRSIGPVTIANGVVFVGSMNNYMYALNAANGQVLWQFQGAGSSNAGPAIVSGKLFWGNGYSRGGTASTTFYSFRMPGGPTSSPTASPTSSPTASPTPSPTASLPPPPACTAAYRIINQWPNGFQAEVTVRAGARPLNGWTVKVVLRQRPDHHPDLERCHRFRPAQRHRTQRQLQRQRCSQRQHRVRLPRHVERHQLGSLIGDLLQPIASGMRRARHAGLAAPIRPGGYRQQPRRRAGRRGRGSSSTSAR